MPWILSDHESGVIAGTTMAVEPQVEDLSGDPTEVWLNQIMGLLDIGPGRDVGEAYAFLLELRMEEGPRSPEQAGAALREWWARRSG